MARRMISKKVQVMDCKMGWPMSRQGNAYRFDSNICKVRVTKGTKGATTPLEDEYRISTIFMIPPPPRKKR